jgi:vacuolar protein sorting-associated protein 13B
MIEGGASPSGLVAGITRGLVGVVAKPLGGAAELVAQTGQGLLTGTGLSNVQHDIEDFSQKSP